MEEWSLEATMICKICGKQLGTEVNFCPACGAKTPARTDPSYDQQSAYRNSGAAEVGGSHQGGVQSGWAESNQVPPRLLRPRSPRMIGGVCAAFALHYGWNLDLVRVVTAIFGLFYGVGILAYLACWIVIPEAQYALPNQSR